MLKDNNERRCQQQMNVSDSFAECQKFLFCIIGSRMDAPWTWTLLDGKKEQAGKESSIKGTAWIETQHRQHLCGVI